MSKTEITIVDCPSSVVVGQAVSVTVEVENIHTSGLAIWTVVVATGKSTGGQVRFIDVEEILPINGTVSHTGAFEMPDEDVDIGAYVYYREEGEYYSDSESHATITATPAGENVIVAMMPLIAMMLLMGIVASMSKSFSKKKSTKMLQAVPVAKVGNLYSGEAHGVIYRIVADTEREAMGYLRDPLLSPIRYPPGRSEGGVVEELLSLGWTHSDPVTDKLLGRYLGLFTGVYFKSFKHSKLPGYVVGFDSEGGYLVKSYLMRGFMRYE